MSAIPWEKEEKRNLICIRDIFDDIVKEGLRKVFKQEWNTRYQAKHGPWDDTNVSGQQLFNLEQMRSRPNKNLYQSKFQHGDTSQWDCSVLFDAILYSNSIGKASLKSTIKTEVDNLRKIRNDLMHADTMKLSDTDFQTITNNVENAFKAFGLPINSITQIVTERNRYQSFQVLPSKPTHEVVHRSEILNEIKYDLQKLNTDSDGKLTYFYISGNPGSGKSQLSRQLCEELFNCVNWQTETTFVMTLNAKDLDSLLCSYEDFCRRLNCNENVLVNIMNSAKPKDGKINDLRSLVTTRIKNWKRWWIIVDNVENLQIIARLLPQIGDEVWNNGQVILTTQNTTSVPSDSSFTKHISLSRGMNDKESRQLLSLLSGSDLNDQLLDEVADRLDHQPLAIAAAAVYFTKVRETNWSPQFSWQDYLKKLDRGKRRITEEQLQRINPEYSSTMTAAVFLAVEKSAAQNSILNVTLYLFSMISFEPLPLDIIVKYIQQLDHTCDKEEIYLAINSCSLFLLTQNDDCDVRLHRVVHEATKLISDSPQLSEINDCSRTGPPNKRTNPDISSTIHNVVKVLFCFNDRDDKIKIIPHLKALNTAVKKLFPEQDSFHLTSLNFEKQEIFKIFSFFGNISDFYGDYKLALEFQNSILQIWGESKEDVNIATVYDDIGTIHTSLGALNEAKECHERALEIRKKQLGLNHVDVATSYNNLGTVYYGKGDLETAKEYHQRALEIWENKLGSNHVDVGTSYNNLGAVYHAKGHLEQAKDYHERALDIQVKQLGSNHIDVATSYNNLGSLYYAKGELEQAKEHHQRALEIQEKQLGSNHVDVASCYNNLGTVYHDKGDLNLAKEYHQRALEILEKQLGLNHVDVASCYNNLGAVYHDKGDLETAKDYHQRALEIQEKQLGSNHVDVAKSYNNLGTVYHRKGDLEIAKDYHERALDIQLKQLGSNHVDVASSYNNLGSLYYAKGELEQAKDYRQRALEVREKQLGSSHVDIATSYNKLRTVYHDKGDLDLAKEYHQRALEIWEKQLGSNHVDVATSYNNLGLLYQAKGVLEEAKACHQRALDIREKQLGSNHVDVAMSYNNLGTLYHDKGDLEKAKDYHERALDIREKQLGSNHVHVASSYNNLGSIYYEKGDLEQAKDYLHRALDIRVKQLGPNHVDVATCYNNLAAVYRAKGDVEQAKDYQQGALDVLLKHQV